MKTQPLSAQKGEILFRKKLLSQELEGRSIFKDEFDSEKIVNMLKERMVKTFNQMTFFKENGEKLSPYVELGAERCQRSLVMENDIGANGAAIDISLDMLKSCDYYKNIFCKNNTPLRICCDAHNLPFRTNSINFIFCYEFLHHFPDPLPIMNEINRIIAPRGLFFFDEEPYKRLLHINLYKGAKAYSEEKLNQNIFMKILDALFAEPQSNEINHGIIENMDISLPMWKKGLNIFDEKHIRISSLHNRINSDLFHRSISYYLNYLLGGTISGICRKHGDIHKNNYLIQNLLICPSCLEKQNECALISKGHYYICYKCGNKYSIIENVILLLSDNKLRELYPEFTGIPLPSGTLIE